MKLFTAAAFAAMLFSLVPCLSPLDAAEPTFLTFATLPQEEDAFACFRTFIPAEEKATTTQTETRFQTFKPPAQQAESQPEKYTPIDRTRPQARLITANFPCPPCEQWKRRLDEIPFDVTVIRSDTSPVTNARGEYLFPVFEYRDRSGRLKQMAVSIDAFLATYRP